MFKRIEGVVVDKDGNPVSRKLFLLDRNTGAKLGETISSSSNGKYTFKLGGTDPHMVLMVSMPGDNSNSYVLDYLVPVDDSIPTNTDIGIPGTAGFGQGNPTTLPYGFSPLHGYDDVYHENYGTYKYEIDGSIMVYIPKFYYKWGTGSNGLDLNACDIKGTATYADEAAANADGYALHRAFIDGGEIKDGFFVDKYVNSLNPSMNVASSLYNKTPVTTAIASPSITSLGVSASNAECITAAKLRGPNFFCMSLFQAKAISMLSYAHGYVSTSREFCNWYGETYNFPKGNINNGTPNAPSNPTYTGNELRAWVSDSNSIVTTGGFSTVEMTTHNGQKCGITDVCGNVAQVTPGLIFLDSNFHVLKESVAMKDITSGESNSVPTDMWATGNLSTLYDNLGPTLSDFSTTSSYVYYTTTNQVFDETTNRSSNAYRLTNIGIPKEGVISTTNPNIFGGGIYRRVSVNIIPVSFGTYNIGANAGVWALSINFSRNSNNNNVGLRSALYP